jgi:hypothetical protein
MSARRGILAVRREHIAGGTFLVLSAAFALAPVSGQSPSADPGADPSAAPAGSPAASVAPTAAPTLPPGGVAPLPARIVSGSCAEPGEERVPLNGPIAGGERAVPSEARPVYASISVVEDALDGVLDGGGALVVGGRVGDPEAAVACGDLDGPRQSDVALAIALEPSNESGYTGTAMLHEADGRVTVTVVVVGPPPEMTPGGSPSPSASAGTDPAPTPSASAGATGSAVPVRPSVEPGTSGAPPFSPLPQASAPLPGG